MTWPEDLCLAVFEVWNPIKQTLIPKCWRTASVLETFTDFIFFLINRVSDPDVIRFNLSAFTSVAEKSHETHVGPQVIHVYELGNRGPSEILKTDVYILWPTKTLSGIHFFSLIDKIILGYSFNHWSIFPILKLIKTMKQWIIF